MAVISVVPGKITQYNISKTEIENNEVKQSFTWISPNSSANYSYVIKYGNAANVTSPNGTSVMTKDIPVKQIYTQIRIFIYIRMYSIIANILYTPKRTYNIIYCIL